MSYYVKDSNGVVHSASPSGSINPFTAAVNFERIPEPYNDFGGAHTEFRSQVHMLPTIIIKDGSKPIYELSYASTFPETANCFTDTNCKGFPWLGNFLLESNNNQYTCYTGSEYGGMLAYVWQFTNEYVSNKEIFAKDKALVELVDRNKGNLLEWQIVDKNIINTYWPNKYGPYGYDNTIKENAYLRCYPSYIDNGQVPSKYINAYTFNSDLFNDDSTFSHENIKTIRCIPERIDNDMFGFTQHIENPSDFGQLNNPISYFTLNVNDITSRGYTGLKLKLHYNVLFNAAYDNNYEPQDLEKLQINNTNCCNSHPFIFNYFLSNSATWDYRTGEEGEGKCISDPTDPNFNLYSSIVKENGIWTAKDIDENHLYTFDVFENKNTDPWGDIKTYNKFYVAKANTGNYYPYLHKVEFLGYNKIYYVCFDFNVGDYNYSNTYTKGSVIKQNDIRYIAQKDSIVANTPPANNNTTSPAYIDNPSNAPWIKLNIEKYTHDYSTEFEEGKFLSACDKNKWGSYSSNFIPYPIINSRDFYLDDVGAGYYPDSQIDYYNIRYLKDKVWSATYVSEFYKHNIYLQGDSYPDFRSGSKVYTNLKYTYTGYRDTKETLSNVIYTSSDNKIYFNSPYRDFTQINFSPSIQDDNYQISLYAYDPVQNLTAGNWYIPWEDASAIGVAYIYVTGSKTYITQVNVDMCGQHPTWSDDPSNKTTYWYVPGRIIRKVINNQVRYIDGVTIQGVFGDDRSTTQERSRRGFFAEVKSVETFNTASNYDCSADGIQIVDGRKLDFFSPSNGYYNLFKNYPYMGHDLPNSGRIEQVFYTYSANNYYKVEDKNSYIDITDSFLTTSYINIITDYYNENWDSTKHYNKFDFIYTPNGNAYVSLMNNTNCDPTKTQGNAPYSKDNLPLTWNESGYSLYNSKYTSYSGLQNFKNFNVRGSTEFTIDLSDTDKQYIHIAYPSTTLLDSDNNSGKFPESACHTFITDLKMTYEGVE